MKERNNIYQINAVNMRNQLYYDFMTQTGVLAPGETFRRAPEYIRAESAAAFSFSENDSLSGIIPH